MGDVLVAAAMRPPATAWRQDTADPVLLGGVMLVAWWDEARGEWRSRLCSRPEDVPVGGWVLSWEDRI